MINNVKNKPLTKEQKELVANNHNLIYTYAHKKDISIDEYYGTLAIGLCKAAKIYDKNKGKFSTIAYRCMENELRMHWKETQKKSVIPENFVLSYDATKTKEDFDNQNNFLENFPDYQSYNDMLYAVMSFEFVEKLTDKENIIFQYLLDGLTHNEIANKLGCKRQSVAYHINNIRNKVIDYLY